MLALFANQIEIFISFFPYNFFLLIDFDVRSDSSLVVRHNMQDFGLIVLLLAKAAGRGANFRFDEEELDEKSGVLFTQRALAEITEMIRASHLVHQGMVNLQPMSEVGQNYAIHHEIASSNKIVLLSGDYLLGCSCNALAGLR